MADPAQRRAPRRRVVAAGAPGVCSTRPPQWPPARIGVAQIEAVQDHGIIAMVKHFAVNNQETNRTEIDVQVDERTLRQIYLPPFEAAVRDADVASFMCSYNKVNGVYACENPDLLQGILRDDWGFEGFVQSDFFATVAPWCRPT
ncbi:MAG: glycoside hydrolase family 3 N-terminal domain-containing protein [Aquihabitans sp.]